MRLAISKGIVSIVGKAGEAFQINCKCTALAECMYLNYAEIAFPTKDVEYGVSFNYNPNHFTISTIRDLYKA